MLAIFLLSLFGFIIVGVPIAFSLMLTAIVLMYFQPGVAPEFYSSLLAQNLMRGIDNFALLAIPFFLLAGEIMNYGGISKRIVAFAQALMGFILGGMGYVTVVASMLFAGVSGSAIADTSAIGSILFPVMEKEGYSKYRSAALISAAGCIGPIIPPSIPMIILGVVGGLSIVKLFLGGIIPGILIGIGLMVVWGIHSKKAGYKKATDKFSTKDVVLTARDAFWALLLPFIILGGILFGVYTPTEAAVIAVIYALVVAYFIYGELNPKDLPEIFMKTAKSSAVVLFVCGAATSAGYMITIAQIPTLLSEFVVAIAGDSTIMVMLLVNILLLLVGCVMDLTPALLILAPILLPMAEQFGIDTIYFGVVMVVNLCIGLITPPVGTVLYVGCGISGQSIAQISRGILPFISVMIVVLFIITYVPGVITFIPNMIG